jgi:hypothetical protein
METLKDYLTAPAIFLTRIADSWDEMFLILIEMPVVKLSSVNKKRQNINSLRNVDYTFCFVLEKLTFKNGMF